MKDLSNLKEEYFPELGKFVHQHITDLINCYTETKRKHEKYTKSMFTIDLIGGGKKSEWIQISIGLISNPLQFYNNGTIHGETENEYGEIINNIAEASLKIIDILENNSVNCQIGKQILEQLEQLIIKTNDNINTRG